MKLIDKIMREICAEMEWEDYQGTDTFSGTLRARLAPIADAADAVIEAAEAYANQWGAALPKGGKVICNAVAKYRDVSKDETEKPK